MVYATGPNGCTPWYTPWCAPLCILRKMETHGVYNGPNHSVYHGTSHGTTGPIVRVRVDVDAGIGIEWCESYCVQEVGTRTVCQLAGA